MQGIELEKNVSDKFTRHTLRNWYKFLKQYKPPKEGSKRTSDEYTLDQVAFLVRMLQATAKEGLPPGRAAENAARDWFQDQEQNISRLLQGMAHAGVELISTDTSRVLIALLQDRAPIPTNVIRRGVSLDRFARMLQMLLEAKESSILLPDRSGHEDLILVADSKPAGDPTQLGHRIRNYSESSLAIAEAARTKTRINLLAPSYQNEVNPENKSLLAVPLVDRKQNLRAIIQAEGKLPPKGMQFGAFDDHDERVITAVAGALLPLLELQRMLVRGIGLLDQLSAISQVNSIWTFAKFAQELVKAALTLASADHAEISIWQPNCGLVFHAVDGSNALKEGEALESDAPSVTYWVYWHGEPLHIGDVRAGDLPVNYRACNEGMGSEIAVPLLVPYSNFRDSPPPCFGVLNVESKKRAGEGGLEKEDIPLLQSLATFGSVGFQLAEFKNCLGERLSLREMKLICGKITEIASRKTGKTFRAALYLVDYKVGRLILKEPSDAETPQLRFETDSVKALALRVVEEKKGLFSSLPETDPRVWRGGLEKFGIHGSLIAVPLLFRSGIGQTVVAVISLWNETSESKPERLTDIEAQEIIQLCEKELELLPGLKSLVDSENSTKAPSGPKVSLVHHKGNFVFTEGTARPINIRGRTDFRRMLLADTAYSELFLHGLHATAVVKDLRFEYLWQNRLHRELTAAGFRWPEPFSNPIRKHDESVIKSRRASGFFERIPVDPEGRNSRQRFSVRFPILDTGGRIAMLGVLGCDFGLEDLDHPPGRTVAFEPREGTPGEYDAMSSLDRAFSELILTDVPAVAMIKSVGSTVLWANPAYESLTATTLEGLIGKRPNEIWPDETANKILEDDEEVVRNGTVTGRFHTVRGNYERFTIRFPIFGETGRVVMIGALGLYAAEKSFGNVEAVVLAQPQDVALGRRERG